MFASRYAFRCAWRFDTSADAVWAAFADPGTWPEWWPDVVTTRLEVPGGVDGIGARWYYEWRSLVGKPLAFRGLNEHIVPGRLQEGPTWGDLAGWGRTELRPTDDGVEVEYTWFVETTRWWMNVVAPVARPWFERNHAATMQHGAEGLAGHLGVRLLGQRTEVVADPVWPGMEPR